MWVLDVRRTGFVDAAVFLAQLYLTFGMSELVRSTQVSLVVVVQIELGDLVWLREIAMERDLLLTSSHPVCKVTLKLSDEVSLWVGVLGGFAEVLLLHAHVLTDLPQSCVAQVL